VLENVSDKVIGGFCEKALEGRLEYILALAVGDDQRLCGATALQRRIDSSTIIADQQVLLN